MRSLSRNVYKRGNVDWQKAAYPELMDILNRLPETEEAEEAAAAQKEQEEKGLPVHYHRRDLLHERAAAPFFHTQTPCKARFAASSNI